jgi:hypothetical protein
VVTRSRTYLAGGLIAAAALVWALVLRAGPPGVGALVATPAKPKPEPRAELPRIGLDRLTAVRPEATVGRRDLFEFGGMATVPLEAPSSEPAPTPPQPVAGDPGSSPALTKELVSGPTSRAAALSRLSYIGTVKSQEGLEVAVLLTEDAEVLTGRVGDVVANRVKIVSIGLESVDVQGVGSDRVQRLPLKGSR